MSRSLDRLAPLLPPVLAVLVTSPLLRPGHQLHVDSYRATDWIEAAKYADYAARTWAEHGVLPLWNPFVNGGLPAFAHPSDGSLSPLFVLCILFGALRGMQITAVLLAAIGAAGTYALARVGLRLERWDAAFAGSAFAVSGWVASRVAVGFYESLLLAVVPAVLALSIAAARAGPRAGAGLLVGGALLLATAGVQMQLCLPFAGLTMAAFVLLRDREEGAPSRWRELGILAAVGGASAGLAAPKFLPMLEWMASRGGRPAALDEPVAPFEALWTAFTHLPLTIPAVGSYAPGGWPLEPEYAFGGVPIVALAFLPVVLVDRRGRALWGLFLGTLLLSWQPASGFQFSLFPVVRWLPLFDAMRDTSRYVTFFAVLWLCLGAGLALELLRQRAREHRPDRPVSPLVFAALFLALLPQGVRSASLLADAFAPDAVGLDPYLGTPADGFHHVALDGVPAAGTREVALMALTAPRRGVGVIAHEEDFAGAPPSPVTPRYRIAEDGTRTEEPGYRGEAWAVRPSGLFAVGPPGPDTRRLTTGNNDLVVINQRFDPGWSASHGVVLVDHEGLLGVRGGSPSTTTLTYSSPALARGAGVTLLTLVLLLATPWALRRREPAP